MDFQRENKREKTWLSNLSNMFLFRFFQRGKAISMTLVNVGLKAHTPQLK